MNIDNNLVQKYAPVIASALILIVPAVDVLSRNPSPLAILQFIALLAATVATFQLRTPWKQLAEWVGVVVAAVIPLVVSGDATWTNWALVVVAIVKALATHLGIAMRRDEVTDPAPVPGLYPTELVTDHTELDLAGSALVPGDGLAEAEVDGTRGRHEL